MFRSFGVFLIIAVIRYAYVSSLAQEHYVRPSVLGFSHFSLEQHDVVPLHDYFKYSLVAYTHECTESPLVCVRALAQCVTRRCEWMSAGVRRAR